MNDREENEINKSVGEDEDSGTTTAAESLSEEAKPPSTKKGTVEDDENPADIAFPTELCRHESVPGAFRQGGINNQSNNHDENGDDDNNTAEDENDNNLHDVESSNTNTSNLVEGPLISAHLVEDDDRVLVERHADVKPAVLAHAEPIPPRKPFYQKWRYLYLGIAICGIVALAVGLSLALTTTNKNKNNKESVPANKEESFQDLWQRMQLQSNHAVLWGKQTSCNTTTLPYITVSCPESVRIESTENSTCERQDTTSITCTMYSTSNHAGVLFACAAHRDHKLAGTAYLSPTTATNCNNNNNNDDVSSVERRQKTSR